MITRIVFMTAWPLFFGLAVIMLGNGLQGTLLGLRASSEGFGSFSIGIIMSMYYVGFLAGSIVVPQWIQNVGYIRVFTALTAMASVTVLTHGVFIDPTIWVFARIVTGFSFAGLFVVIESWINSLANRKSRGKVLAVYNIVNYSALAAGQFFLYIATPDTIHPFILVSVLVSLAAIPVALSRRPAPAHDQPEPLGLKKMWKVSPLSCVSVSISGFSVGALFAITPVYSSTIGIETNEIAKLMAIFILGGIVAQAPIGMLSDYFGRRKIIIAVTLCAGIVSIFCMLSSKYEFLPFELFFFVMGGFSLSLYALGSALAIDRLRTGQYVSAAGTLLIISGSGAIIGPFTVSALMIIDTSLFFISITTAYFFVVIFGLYRSTIRESLPAEEQEKFVAVSASDSFTTQVVGQVVEETAWKEAREAKKTKQAESIENSKTSEDSTKSEDLKN